MEPMTFHLCRPVLSKAALLPSYLFVHDIFQLMKSSDTPFFNRIHFMALYMAIIVTLLLIFFSRLFILPGQVDLLTNTVNHLFFYDRFIAEYCFISAVIILFINGSAISRTLATLLLGALILVNITQLTSLFLGGEFLSRLAIDNSNHINILFDKRIALLLGGILLLSLLPEVVIRLAKLPAASKKRTATIVLPLLLLGIFFSQSHSWIPDKTQKKLVNIFIDNNIRHTSPLYALYRVFAHRDMTLFSQDFTEAELQRLKQFGFILNNEKPYPLIKHSIYQGALPFASNQGSKEDPPSVILFFNEGISARSLSVYGNTYPEITPHLQDFAKKSMVVKNYYNHTAATYRGLHGQLCSMFPTHGGNSGLYPTFKTFQNTHYLSLPNILQQEGYDTLFLDAHLKEKAYVDDMVKMLGFQQVLTANELSREYLGGTKPAQGDALSDSQLFQCLIGVLKKKEVTNKNRKKPFLLSMYNYGTHSWVNPVNGESHYGDKGNTTLNSVHNLDHAFGLFWTYFQNSSFADNTIIVFTTDHCHYPTQDFIAGVNDPDFQRIFVDKVPLIIHDRTKKLPPSYDADNRTTLDLTPTLLHYLGIKNQPNPFLGNSLFSRKEHPFSLGISSIPPETYIIGSSKIHSTTNSRRYRQDLQLIERFLALNRILEGNDRIWKNGSEQ